MNRGVPGSAGWTRLRILACDPGIDKLSAVWQADISLSKRSELDMAQDYLARLDLLDFPPWHVDDAGIGTDAPGVASANVWRRVLSVARGGWLTRLGQGCSAAWLGGPARYG
jgi:hypothetical protein